MPRALARIPPTCSALAALALASTMAAPGPATALAWNTAAADLWAFEGPATMSVAPGGGTACPEGPPATEGTLRAALLDRPQAADALTFWFTSPDSDATCTVRGCVGLGDPAQGWAGPCLDMPWNKWILLPNQDGTWRFRFEAELGPLGWALEALAAFGEATPVPGVFPSMRPVLPAGERYQGRASLSGLEGGSPMECAATYPGQAGDLEVAVTPSASRTSAVAWWRFLRDADGCAVARICVLHPDALLGFAPRDGTCPDPTMFAGSLVFAPLPDGAHRFGASFSVPGNAGWGVWGVVAAER